MNAKSWIILGFIGIVIGIVVPAVLTFEMMGDLRSAGPFSGKTGQLHQSMQSMMIFGTLSQIFFWGGIVSTVFGLIKFYKEKN